MLYNVTLCYVITCYTIRYQHKHNIYIIIAIINIISIIIAPRYPYDLDSVLARPRQTRLRRLGSRADRKEKGQPKGGTGAREMARRENGKTFLLYRRTGFDEMVW